MSIKLLAVICIDFNIIKIIYNFIKDTIRSIFIYHICMMQDACI